MWKFISYVQTAKLNIFCVKIQIVLAKNTDKLLKTIKGYYKSGIK